MSLPSLLVMDETVLVEMVNEAETNLNALKVI